MNVKSKRRLILQALTDANDCRSQWKEVQEKAVNQLYSMSNLAEQLAALRRCRHGRHRLGCLNAYPDQLPELLEGKIFMSFERALTFVYKHTRSLEDICKKLKCHWKESSRHLADILELQGDERALTTDVDSFSLGDVTEWLRIMYATRVYELSERWRVLSGVECSVAVMERVCHVWTSDPNAQLTEILDSVEYTVEQFKTSTNE